MPIFKKDSEDDGKRKKEKTKKTKGKLFQTKSGRWITPQEKKKYDIKGADEKDVDENVQETVSQIDVDIPGMVVLHSKEDRHLGRLDQDMKAKEDYKKQTRRVQKPPELPDFSGMVQGQPGVSGRAGAADPALLESGRMILDRLIEEERITAEQREKVLSISSEKGITVEEAITEIQAISERDLGTFIAGECKIPFSNLDVLRVSPKARDVLTQEQMMRFRAVPLSKIGPTLNIAAVNPLENPIIENLRSESGYEVKCIVCTSSALKKTIKSFNE